MTESMPRNPEPRHRVALVLVDVNRAFFDPRGSSYYPGVEELVEPLAQLLDAARRGGRMVIHAREAHRPGLYDAERTKLPVHCVANELDAEPWPGFEERTGEVYLPKRRYSAFFATDLALLLHEQQTEQIVIAGVKTNVCIRATAQDSFAHGFRTSVVRQAVSSNRPHLHVASLEDVERYLGEVIELEDAIRRICADDD